MLNTGETSVLDEEGKNPMPKLTHSRYKWFYIQFDISWVTCANHACKTEYLLKDVYRKRKCPVCKMNNKHCLPSTIAQLRSAGYIVHKSR